MKGGNQVPGLKTHPEVVRQSMIELMEVALGEAEADLAIVNGSIVNVYTGEVLSGDTVLVKGDKIAYVGKNTGKSIGHSTTVIDATGKTLVPGFIDGHTHLDFIYSISELARYAMKGGTTTIITELSGLVFPMGYQGIIEFLRSAQNQPIKFFITAPPMVSINPVAREHALNVGELRRLLRRKEVLGLGELYWAPVVDGDPRSLDLIAETIKTGKKVEGHSAGARGNKLQAYISLGISSCHEPTTAEEALERLRAGLTVFAREGVGRSDLEAISKIKDAKIDFRRLALATDGLEPDQLINQGYMDFVVQKAIKLGFDPVLAIQMATINVAQHFAIDDTIGGIAPGKYADIIIVPDLRTIRAEYVISNGRVIVKDGKLVVSPRKHNYPKSAQNTIRLPRSLDANDFSVAVEGGRRQVKARVVDMVTDSLTKIALADIPVVGGFAQLDTSQDVVKVAAIDRANQPGKTFVGFIRGTGLKHGAVASSLPTDCWDIIVIGASEADMAQAVNRLAELRGGIVACANSKVLAELALPIASVLSPEPMEVVAAKLCSVKQAAAELGCVLADIRNTLAFLGSEAIPFVRICEQGLIDLKQNQIVDLIAD
jgi:adenine deaminase